MMLEKGALEASENDIPVYPDEYGRILQKLKIIWGFPHADKQIICAETAQIIDIRRLL